jgi:hypothetical protein
MTLPFPAQLFICLVFRTSELTVGLAKMHSAAVADLAESISVARHGWSLNPRDSPNLAIATSEALRLNWARALENIARHMRPVLTLRSRAR